MLEFVILSFGLVSIVALLMRRGADRLAKPWVLGAFMGFGAQTGAFLELMPFTPMHASFSLRTVVAAMIGVFAMRLLARGVVAWGRGYRDEEIGTTRDQARLLHPLVAVGIALSGVLALHEATASRHLALEIENTLRDRETGIVDGAEPIALDTEGAREAVLLFHGYFGSPSELGALPEALHAAGYTIRAPLMPGHGTTPRELAETHPDQWRDAALAAFDELATTHETVHVGGFSFGGWLALEVGAARDAGRVVVVNPYLGKTWTPSWLPVSTDALAEFMAPLLSYAMRPEWMSRLADESMREQVRAYRTLPIATTVELTQATDEAVRKGLVEDVDEPLLVLLGERDRTAPAEVAHATFAALEDRGDDFELRSFEASDHILLLDTDREAAIDAAVEWFGR